MNKYLQLAAVDLGASSGRLVLGTLDDRRLQIKTLHRFDTRPTRLPDGLMTNVAHIWRELLKGLSTVAGHCGTLDGIGVDTWGVDFALLDADGGLLSLPYHYRDKLAEAMEEWAFATLSREQLYAYTGIQSLPFNTLYQLLGLRARRPALLAAARQLLFIPDLFAHWLGGQAQAERTIASTSQCYDPRQRDWAWQIIEQLDLPRELFGPLVEPGSQVGMLRATLAQEAGLPPCPVLAPGGHDTALAVAAVPADVSDFAYISSGTWSLVGVEEQQPHLDEAACAANLTNEIGVCQTVRFLKNVSGLWLVQECHRTWTEAGWKFSFGELTALAEKAAPWRVVLDVDDPSFVHPGDMPARIASYCQRTGQACLEDPGAIVRTILEGLALKYRFVLAQLEKLTGRVLSTVHVVGGGTQNRLLCQLTADATERLTLAGPVEATAVGNVLMQAMALGQLGSLRDLREVVRNSFELERYEPRPSPGLEEAYESLRHRLTEDVEPSA